MQGSPNKASAPHREILNLLHQTCWWSGSARGVSRVRFGPLATFPRNHVDAGPEGTRVTKRVPVEAAGWCTAGIRVGRRDASCPRNLWSDGFKLAHVHERDHIRDMASRKPALVISKLNHDLVRGALLGLLVFLALSASLAAFYFGI
jgi:hypothetical protein